MATDPRPRARARPRPVLVALVACAYVLLLAGTGVAAASLGGERVVTIAATVEAGARRVPVQVADGEPVLSVLTTAGVVPRNGRLLGARDRRILDPDHDPARYTVDGRSATAATPVHDGQVVGVVAGTDSVEATRREVVPVPAPALPDVLRHVHQRGRAGKAEHVIGVVSGDEVSSRVLVPPVAPAIVTGKVVALTFDDGPTDKWTPQVLDMLKAKGIKATFCQVGTQVDYFPALAQRAVAEGHQLCNHTVHHSEALRGAPQERLDAEIAGGAATFERQGLPRPAYYRPPGGFLDAGIIATAQREGETVLHWSVDTEDWHRNIHPFLVAANIFSAIKPGAIVLVHDGGGKDRMSTILAVGAVIDQLKAQGWQFTFPVIDPPPA